MFVATGAWGSLVPLPEAAGEEGPACGAPLSVSQVDGEAFSADSTRVVLALDDEWGARFGDQAEQVARSLLIEVGGLFKGLHIHLLPVRVETWTSPDGATSARELGHIARAAVSSDGADIVIALTGTPLTPEDGWAEVGGRYALVAHHPGAPARDAIVLAHEIAHLFGADHGCDVPGYEGLMAERGFEEARLICPCTRQILESNAARFHDDRAGTEGASESQPLRADEPE